MSNFTPGQVVRVLNASESENGIVGYVARTKPNNGDTILVGVISAPGNSDWATKPGTRLSYNAENLEVVPK